LGLKKIGVNNLGLSFTIMNENVSELKAVYDLSKQLEVELALALVQNSDIYFNKKDNQLSYIEQAREGLNYVIGEELKSRNPKRWARAYYDFGLLRYAESGKRLLKSGAGFDSLFVDAYGNIFPSNLISLKIGNLTENKLDEIWNSAMAGKIRKKIIEENIQESWIICTIRGEMKRNIFQVLKWVFVNKISR
jgi:MoaA/NifB/PqqE/SkfB family radical SAM enzyme